VSELWSWVEELDEAGPVRLTPDEARHVAARRLRVGDSLVVFDGRGHTAEGRIESIGKNSTVIIAESISETARPESRFVLASAIPKGDRLSTMLQMLTQLGLDAWQPLVLEDSVVRKLDPKAARLVRILTESCKVSRRPWLLEVRQPCSLEAVLSGRPSGAEIVFGDQAGESIGFDGPAGLTLIGPEAGFSESERRVLIGVGARPRSFGAHNLRIETAAVAAAVALHLARADNSSGDTGA
jgi:16S rRNA (uracil1498-N3)-methyltransferase